MKGTPKFNDNHFHDQKIQQRLKLEKQKPESSSPMK